MLFSIDTSPVAAFSASAGCPDQNAPLVTVSFG
jgi:hypothetical protein